MNIAIIGPRGVGKSKVSRRLSKLIGVPFITTDMMAVYINGGLSIPEYIKRQNGNWQPFRQLEFQILQHLQKAEDIILDCGGGILFDVDEFGQEFFSEQKFHLLKSLAKIVFLTRDTDYLIQKVIDDPARPSLSEITSYREILARRMPYYEKSADLIQEADGLSSKQLARILAKKLSLLPVSIEE